MIWYPYEQMKTMKAPYKIVDADGVYLYTEAIQELLQAIDLEKDSAELKAELEDATGQKRARIIKRLEVVEAFRESGNKPEWSRSGKIMWKMVIPF